MQLVVTTIQTELAWENKAENLLHFSKKIAEITTKTDIIILPEMFSTGFSMNAQKLAETMQGETISWMKAEASKQNAVIIASLIIEEKGNYFNRLVWMQPNGEHYHYDKRHLFSMAGENKSYTPGNNRLVVHYKGWRICPLICYDLRFPVWSRNISFDAAKTNNEFDCLIYIANWPITRISHWDKLLEARAIENQCYVVGVNRIGQDGSNLTYSGNSAIINPKGEKISSTKPTTESIETILLNKEELEVYRNKFPLIDDADNFQLDSYTLIVNNGVDIFPK